MEDKFAYNPFNRHISKMVDASMLNFVQKQGFVLSYIKRLKETLRCSLTELKGHLNRLRTIKALPSSNEDVSQNNTNMSQTLPESSEKEEHLESSIILKENDNIAFKRNKKRVFKCVSYNNIEPKSDSEDLSPRELSDKDFEENELADEEIYRTVFKDSEKFLGDDFEEDQGQSKTLKIMY